MCDQRSPSYDHQVAVEARFADLIYRRLGVLVSAKALASFIAEDWSLVSKYAHMIHNKYGSLEEVAATAAAAVRTAKGPQPQGYYTPRERPEKEERDVIAYRDGSGDVVFYERVKDTANVPSKVRLVKRA